MNLNDLLKRLFKNIESIIYADRKYEKFDKSLKCCPFCGGKAKLFESIITERVYVICEECGAETFNHHDTVAMAINEWNDHWW